MERINKIVILKEIKEQMKKILGENIQDVILFGSYVNGNAHKYSDYDILVVLKNDYDWKLEKEISEICYSIDLKYDIFTDTHLISQNQIKNSIKGKDPLFINALKNGYYV
ncbi:MAG: hypothetical protein COS14_03685 [Bacteroidetes bacterium CG02_land_8_20_14_3_00_31_25]|jgi:predicted nucleotidyltransferase|nr:MAG: hypothetical protein A2X08_04905 [Bacteroidetes bacterium GWA2_32_17]PIV61952.1 MAG: hypothetical protein COS14_03685 [Bacteroidetes bacterium CG02_land_8_20_14_3_00_31_25]PIY05185.1 MAG: hypothetical protein COZ21_04620 [Bacteroidetes bacterium CG_4_10_14_3_um_filter_31_20]